MTVDIAGYIYAGIVLVGGLIGYFKAQSKASLISGLAFGGLLAFAAFMTGKDARNAWIALASSSTLFLLMGWRFQRSRKFMPAGLVTVLSAGMAIRYGNVFLSQV